MVTDRPGIALGIVTADCTPVLFADPAAGVVGAAHAGWRGAVAGVIEATIAAMVRLGRAAGTIAAAIGPCIRQHSYEVGADLRDAVLATTPPALASSPPAGARPLAVRPAGYCAAPPGRRGHSLIVDIIDADTAGRRGALLQPPPPHPWRRRPDRAPDFHHCTRSKVIRDLPSQPVICCCCCWHPAATCRSRSSAIPAPTAECSRNRRRRGLRCRRRPTRCCPTMRAGSLPMRSPPACRHRRCRRSPTRCARTTGSWSPPPSSGARRWCRCSPCGPRRARKRARPRAARSPTQAWAAAAPATLQQSAADAAPKISRLLTSIQRAHADPNSLYNRIAKVEVAAVTGAPGRRQRFAHQADAHPPRRARARGAGQRQRRRFHRAGLRPHGADRAAASSGWKSSGP